MTEAGEQSRALSTSRLRTSGWRKRAGCFLIVLVAMAVVRFGIEAIHEARLSAWRRKVEEVGLDADMYRWHRFEWPSGHPLLENVFQRDEAFIVVETQQRAEALLERGRPPVDVRIDCDPTRIPADVRQRLRKELRATVVERAL
jgi:hypothetical protein